MYLNTVHIEVELALSICYSSDLPDIVPDVQALESSVYLQKMSLWLLECALEENCLPEQVYRLIDNNPSKESTHCIILIYSVDFPYNAPS
jgi:hypothetical protein